MTGITPPYDTSAALAAKHCWDCVGEPPYCRYEQDPAECPGPVNSNTVADLWNLREDLTPKGAEIEENLVERVENWNERIILPPISIDTKPRPIGYEQEDADDIVVEVSPRNMRT
jgi:hypothetical protein